MIAMAATARLLAAVDSKGKVLYSPHHRPAFVGALFFLAAKI